MTLTRTKQAVWDMLKKVSDDGMPQHFTAPECGGLWPSRDYYNLKRGIMYSETYWKRGRAGFAYDSRRIITPAQEGIWIFPNLDDAIIHRNTMLTEGYVCALYSWKVLEKTA